MLLAVVGCGTVQEHRARQYAQAFEREDTQLQEQALEGELVRGMRPVSVYVALGTPEAAERMDGAGVSWYYFGRQLPEDEAAGPEREEALWPPFQSRSEPRIPRMGEERQLLELRFRGRQLLSWEIRPLEPDDLQLKRDTDYGRMPLVD